MSSLRKIVFACVSCALLVAPGCGDDADPPGKDAGLDLSARDSVGTEGAPPSDALAPDTAVPDTLAPDTVAPDVTPPTLAGSMPADGGALGCKSALTITFSEAVKTDSLKLGEALGGAAGAPAWSAGDTKVELTPSGGDWPEGAGQKLKVEVSDAAGNPATIELTFDVDCTAPTVTNIVPDTGYAPWTQLTVTFSEKIDPATLALGGDIGAAKHSWTSETELVIEPDTAWTPGDGRTLTIECADLAGNAIDPSPLEHVVDVHYITKPASQGDVGSYPSLAVDAGGDGVYISYLDEGKMELMFVSSADGGKSFTAPVKVDAAEGRHSMALVGDKVYVAYYGNANGDNYRDMVFIRSDDKGVTWDTASKRKIVSAGDKPGDWGWHYGDYNDMAVSGGKIHLAYHQFVYGPDTEYHLIYARSDDDGASWVTPVNNPGCVNLRSAHRAGIAVLNDTVFIAGHQLSSSTDRRLGVVKSVDNGAVWGGCTYPDPTAPAKRVGQHVSIAARGFGATGKVLVAYFNSTDGDLKLVRSDDAAATWAEPVTVDSTDTVGSYTSIATDSSAGTVYLSYYDETNKDLKFARSDDGGATWPTIRAVDGAQDVGKYTSIAISGSGAATKVSIAYYDETSKDLKLARSVDNGESW